MTRRRAETPKALLALALWLMPTLAAAQAQDQQTQQAPSAPEASPDAAKPDAQDTSAKKSAPPKPPPPPDGILPVAEIARIEYGPRDRPRVRIDNGKLIVVTASGEVAGYDVSTGEFAWKLGLPGENLFEPVPVAGEKKSVLVASRSGLLVFLDETNGAILREIPGSTELALAPAVALPLIYLGTPSGTVIAFDVEAGTERFRTETGEIPMALSLGGELLVVSGGERTLTAIDRSTGEERWVLRARSGFYAPAAFDAKEEKLYIGDDAGEFYCLEVRSGKRCFRWSTGASIRAPVLVEDKRVYVASYGNNLYCYQAGGGAEQWRTSIPGRPASGAVRIHNRLLVATLDGILIEVNPVQGGLGKSFGAPGELASAPAYFVAHPTPADLKAAKELAEAEQKARTATEEERAASRHDTGTAPSEETLEPSTSEPAQGSALEEAVAEVESPEDLEAPLPMDVPAGPPPWYAAHRVALSLRTGEVVLFAHKAPEPKAAPEGAGGPEEKRGPEEERGKENPSPEGAEPIKPIKPAEPVIEGQTVPKKGTGGPANR